MVTKKCYAFFRGWFSRMWECCADGRGSAGSKDLTKLLILFGAPQKKMPKFLRLGLMLTGPSSGVLPASTWGIEPLTGVPRRERAVSSVLKRSFESGKFFLVIQNSSVGGTDSSRIMLSQVFWIFRCWYDLNCYMLVCWYDMAFLQLKSW